MSIWTVKTVPGKAQRWSRTRIFEEEKANHCGWRGQGEGKWCEMQRREASVGSGRAPWDMFRVLDLFQKQAESQEHLACLDLHFMRMRLASL